MGLINIKLDKSSKKYRYALLIIVNLIFYILMYFLEIEKKKYLFLFILISIIYMLFSIFKNPLSLSFEELKSYSEDKIKNIYYLYWFFHILIGLIAIYTVITLLFGSEKHILVKGLNTIFFLKSISPKNPLFDKNYFIFL